MRGYTEAERGAHSSDQYVLPCASPEERDAFIEHLHALDCADTHTHTPRPKDIVVPTAAVSCAPDPPPPPACAPPLNDAIPGSTLDLLPDVRHFTPEEAPEKIAAVITGLLAR